MKKTKCLICVDLQRDFCPGGSLAVPDGDVIIPKINNLLEKFDLIIFTKDWHSPEQNAFASQHEGAKPFDKYTPSTSFEEDILWPDHCVENTLGAEFHPDLDLSRCKKDFYIFKKGNSPDFHPYSGFAEVDENNESELKVFLNERGVVETYICGLALDYCVKDTAIDSAMAGFDTHVILDCTMPINKDTDSTLTDLKEAGVTCGDTWVFEFLGNI